MWKGSKIVFRTSLGKRQWLVENRVSSHCLSTSVLPNAQKKTEAVEAKSQNVRHKSTFTHPTGKRFTAPGVQQQQNFSIDLEQVPVPDYSEKSVFRGLETDFPCLAKK
jgi:hypothetical protein